MAVELSRSPERPDGSDERRLVGEMTRRSLREDERAIDGHVENAAVPLDELRLDAQLTRQPGPQTGGPRKIISSAAVCDSDLHGCLPELYLSLRSDAPRESHELVAS